MGKSYVPGHRGRKWQIGRVPLELVLGFESEGPRFKYSNSLGLFPPQENEEIGLDDHQGPSHVNLEPGET